MSHFTLGVVNDGGGECRGGECRTIAWVTPMIWFASICLGILLAGLSFPQILHVAKLPWPVPVLILLFVIIDLICLSRSSKPTLVLSLLSALDSWISPFWPPGHQISHLS